MLIIPFLFSLFVQASEKELLYEDRVYEDQIKFVRLFPETDNPEAKILPAVMNINGHPLQLEFDDLQEDKSNYYVKILSCNFDWTPSRLHDLDFMKDYNEFNINDYTYSNNTHIPYIHYRFLIPLVKLPGNYLLMVYRDGDKEDLIITRRFMVSNGVASIKPEANFGMNTLKGTHQQINFVVDYNGIDIPNPLETVHVVVRQNQRWDNIQSDIRPSFVREGNKTLEYRYFDNDNGFLAGNEFRFVDFRSLNSPGQNVGQLNRGKKPYTLYVAIDQSRPDQRYAQFRDLNGNYMLENYDMGAPEISSHYVEVVFTLQTPRPLQSKVYVMGAFNNWAKDESNQMHFEQDRYTCEILLKQGFYNYGYEPEAKNESVEGNHFETENQYEIFVYNHSYYPEADLLVGYYPFVLNKR